MLPSNQSKNLMLPCIRKIATIVIIYVSHREVNTESHYQGNFCVLLHQQKNGEMFPVTSKRHGIYPMFWVQSMANILEFKVQNRGEPFFIIIKNASVLYFWQFVMLATASHYLMLVIMEAITILER